MFTRNVISIKRQPTGTLIGVVSATLVIAALCIIFKCIRRRGEKIDLKPVSNDRLDSYADYSPLPADQFVRPERPSKGKLNPDRHTSI